MGPYQQIYPSYEDRARADAAIVGKLEELLREIRSQGGGGGGGQNAANTSTNTARTAVAAESMASGISALASGRFGAASMEVGSAVRNSVQGIR